MQAKTNKLSTTLLVLGILTVIGNFFLLFKGMISYAVLVATNDNRTEDAIVAIDLLYLVEFLTCIGAMVGVIFMLNRKKIGLLIYGISNGLYIVLTIAFAIFCMFTIIGIPVSVLQFFYVIPAMVFLLLFLINIRQLS